MDRNDSGPPTTYRWPAHGTVSRCPGSSAIQAFSLLNCANAAKQCRGTSLALSGRMSNRALPAAFALSFCLIAFGTAAQAQVSRVPNLEPPAAVETTPANDAVVPPLRLSAEVRQAVLSLEQTPRARATGRRPRAFEPTSMVLRLALRLHRGDAGSRRALDAERPAQRRRRSQPDDAGPRAPARVLHRYEGGDWRSARSWRRARWRRRTRSPPSSPWPCSTRHTARSSITTTRSRARCDSVRLARVPR